MPVLNDEKADSATALQITSMLRLLLNAAPQGALNQLAKLLQNWHH
jgi:hypothetical protein